MNNTPQAPGTGNLIVHVTTARGSIPLEGAQVSVFDYKPEFEEPRGDVIRSAVTDRDGNTEIIPLPAPPRSDSMHPGVANPFAIYNLEVRLEGYGDQSYIALPIFEGITAVQPVDLIPLPENGRSESRRPTEERFFESTGPNL
ncbi:MAG: carboxypeptidase regulatory-like domain-containing protein [Clostridia bacterium]|nr:carboxypeptidase regulatory-like domain-containing protein [Clostridia bacterium]